MLTDPDFITFLSRLVCVPKCAACGERLLPFSKRDNLSYGRVCLCDKCMAEWHIAKREMCHTCYLPAGKGAKQSALYSKAQEISRAF